MQYADLPFRQASIFKYAQQISCCNKIFNIMSVLGKLIMVSSKNKTCSTLSLLWWLHHSWKYLSCAAGMSSAEAAESSPLCSLGFSALGVLAAAFVQHMCPRASLPSLLSSSLPYRLPNYVPLCFCNSEKLIYQTSGWYTHKSSQARDKTGVPASCRELAGSGD